jgi:metal-sulfur cluster biosynthetic enzyme
MATRDPAMALPAPGFAFSGPPAWAPRVRDALAEVVDPEMALDIVNLGLVYGVAATPERVDVSLTMTSAACPVTELIVEDVRAVLARTLGPAVDIAVEVVWQPPWSPQRMSPAARAALGWDE